MTIRLTEAADALRRTSLEPHHQQAALAGLKRAGLVEEKAQTDAMYASAADAPPHFTTLAAAANSKETHRLANQAIGTMRALGLNLPLDARIDVGELDRQLRERQAKVSDRIFLKDMLYKLGLIPA